MNDVSLLIDQRSASLAPAEQDVHAWASGRRVFVSSLITDLPEERAAVRAAIEAVGAAPVMFEDLGAQDVSADQAYLSGVRSSEIYLGIWSRRYGVRMPDGYSATHAEFLEAERNGLRLCLFVGGEASDAMDGSQRDLIQSARNLYTTSPWNDASDLGQRVRHRLEALAAEELAPWVRVGRAFFRAKEITNDGRTVSIVANVRSPAVHSELVHLRDTRAGDAPFASPSVAQHVQFTKLSTRMVSTVAHEEQLELVLRERPSSNMHSSINGISAEEMVCRSLSDGLFGSALLDEQSRWLAQPIDPLASLRGLGLDDEILRPVAQLLFSEYLLAEGAASRIDSFTLGPSHQGSRRLRATWTPLPSYASDPSSTPVSIDGNTKGL